MTLLVISTIFKLNLNSVIFHMNLHDYKIGLIGYSYMEHGIMIPTMPYT